MSKILKTSVLIFLFFIGISLFVSFSYKKEYGVFLGLNNSDAKKLLPYKTIVLEGEEFTENDIKNFHQNGQKVLAYLNIGALEKYRSYYGDYKRFSLGIYQNWSDERWIDVSNEEWQDFIIKKKAFEYYKKGFDGFFIDNTDVYYQYQKDEIYEGLIRILKGLHQYNMEILINGGDTFISKLIDEDINIFDGINQECVFTSIDFNHNKYGQQSSKEHEYFIEYLKKVKAYNKKVYLLEYGANKFIREKIKNYCIKQGFDYFISFDKSLTKEMEW